MNELIAYQPFDGSNGLQLQARTLSAYKEGEEVGRVVVEDQQNLDSLLAFYTIPNLLPDFDFAYEGKRRLRQLELDADFPSEHTLGGHLKTQDEAGYWAAEYIGNNVFLLDEQLPPDVRPWVDSEKIGYGWQIQLPGFLAVELDSVLRRRAALAIEEFLYGLKNKTIETIPWRKKIDNVFSATQPMWSQPLPVVYGDPLPATLEVS